MTAADTLTLYSPRIRRASASGTSRQRRQLTATRDRWPCLAIRGNGKQPDVAVNVEVANVCEDLHFTPAHARQFAESLLAVADELERVGDK